MKNAGELRAQGKEIKEKLLKDIAVKEKFMERITEIVADLEGGKTEKALEFMKSAVEGGEIEISDLKKELRVIENCLDIVDMVDEKNKDKEPEAKP